jgi:hypothetical protein
MEAAYRCCLEGKGTSCCDGVKYNTCFSFGGHRGRCLVESESFDAKETCVVCCEGLSRAPLCGADGQFGGVPSAFVCIRCGDGVCSLGEGPCNCFKDCPLSSASHLNTNARRA